MGAIGGILRATGNNDVNVVSKVKNPALQAQIDAQLRDYSNVKGAGSQALGEYIQQYLGGQKDAAARTSQEIGGIDQYYNGGIESQLAALRNQRRQAVMDAANRSQGYALANMNRSRLAGGGGPSSYDLRVAGRNVGDIATQAALDDASQARGDFNYLQQAKLGLMGARTGLADTLAGRALVPEEARRRLYSGDMANLAQITNLDQANKFYGLKQNPNVWADVADSLDQGVLNGAAIYGSVSGGGMRRGGLVRTRPYMVDGGQVQGPGTGTSDSVPVNVSNGEYVMPASATQIPGVLKLLEGIREFALSMEDRAPSRQQVLAMRRGYADGGMVWSDAVSNPFDSGFNFGDGAGAHDNVGFGGGGGGGSRGGGGGGSGLSAQAMALQARVDRDLTPQWMGATQVSAPFDFRSDLVPNEMNFRDVQAPALKPGAWADKDYKPDEIDRALFDPEYWTNHN